MNATLTWTRRPAAAGCWPAALLESFIEVTVGTGDWQPVEYETGVNEEEARSTPHYQKRENGRPSRRFGAEPGPPGQNEGFADAICRPADPICTTTDAICETTDAACTTTDPICTTTDAICETTDPICTTTDPACTTADVICETTDPTCTTTDAICEEAGRPRRAGVENFNRTRPA
jgi:hypothetical protein